MAGNRYGRNQKRRHRAEMAALKERSEYTENKYNNSMHKLAKELDAANDGSGITHLKEALSTIEERLTRLQKYTVLLDPKYVQMTENAARHLRIPHVPSMDGITPRLDAGMGMDTRQFANITMHRVETFCDYHHEEVATTLHLIARTNPEHYGALMVSQEAIPHIDVERVAKDLVEHLAQSFQKHPPRKY